MNASKRVPVVEAVPAAAFGDVIWLEPVIGPDGHQELAADPAESDPANPAKSSRASWPGPAEGASRGDLETGLRFAHLMASMNRHLSRPYLTPNPLS